MKPVLKLAEIHGLTYIAMAICPLDVDEIYSYRFRLWLTDKTTRPRHDHRNTSYEESNTHMWPLKIFKVYSTANQVLAQRMFDVVGRLGSQGESDLMDEIRLWTAPR